MNSIHSFLTLARQEIHRHHQVFYLCFVVGLLPYILQLIPGKGSGMDGSSRVTLAIILTLVTGGVLVLILGTVLTRDFLSDRISFYFSQPLSVWSLWLGKLSGIWVLVVGGTLLVYLPSALGSFSTDWILDSQTLMTLLGGALAIVWAFSALPAFGLWLRGSKPLQAMDCVIFGVALFILWIAYTNLAREDASGALLAALSVTVGLSALGFILAVGFALDRGRMQPLRIHRNLSVVLLSGWIVLALGNWGYSSWVLDFGKEDLDDWRVSTLVADSWVVVHGIAQNRFSLYGKVGVNPVTGEEINLGRRRYLLRSSKDGIRLALVHHQTRPSLSTLFNWRRQKGYHKVLVGVPGKDPSQWTPLPIPFSHKIKDLIFAPESNHLVVISQSTLEVWSFDSPSPELIDQTQLQGFKELEVLRSEFIERRALRIVAHQKDTVSGEFAVYDFDLTRLESTSVPSRTLSPGGWGVAFDESMNFMLTRPYLNNDGSLSDEGSLVLCNLNSGTLHPLPQPLLPRSESSFSDLRPPSLKAELLYDGRVVVFETRDEKTIVSVYGVEGTLLNSITLDHSLLTTDSLSFTQLDTQHLVVPLRSSADGIRWNRLNLETGVLNPSECIIKKHREEHSGDESCFPVGSYFNFHYSQVSSAGFLMGHPLNNYVNIGSQGQSHFRTIDWTTGEFGDSL